METWVNQVLSGPAKQHTTGLPNQQPLQASSLSMKGLLNHGLSREELGAAGLGGEAVDRLYRALYVYSVGLFDTLQVGGVLVRAYTRLISWHRQWLHSGHMKELFSV